MQRFLRIMAIAALIAAMCAPCAIARGRNPEKQHNSVQHEKKRPDKHRGDKGKDFKKHNRHHDNKYHGNHRPPRPPQSHRPPHRPPYHNVHHGRPHRPHMPRHWHYYRPTPPPPAWRPRHWRPFRSILGIALGSAENISINALVNNGYTVSGYDDNIVYLSNVPMLNYSWPAANLYYSNGGLYGSEFVYSTPGHNMGRYNAVYNSLTGVYGAPYNVQMLAGGGRRATWWGNDGQYITLSFAANTAANGASRFFTTLSFGR